MVNQLILGWDSPLEFWFLFAEAPEATECLCQDCNLFMFIMNFLIYCAEGTKELWKDIVCHLLTEF